MGRKKNETVPTGEPQAVEAPAENPGRTRKPMECRLLKRLDADPATYGVQAMVASIPAGRQYVADNNLTGEFLVVTIRDQFKTAKIEQLAFS